MSGLGHVDDYPEIPVSLAPTSALLKTGAWRSVRPVLAKRTAPCTADCPAGIDIPAYLDELRQDNLDTALALFTARNPFPRITGRVCPHFCESGCNLAFASDEESVSIRSIERWLGDKTAHRPHPQPADETGKQIAVVGAGPAGMAAAFYLRRSGHKVTVFERREHAGGVLRRGIPEYRLPTSVVDEEVARLEGMGVEFRTGVALGTDFTLEDLEAAYAAVFLATGAAKERHTGIEGESLLEPGLAFLEAANRNLATLPGERCAVIGGGNTAMDVARVLRRMGAHATVLYRRTADEMPAIAEEYERAAADGVVFEWLVLPRSIEKLNGELLVTVEHMRLGEPDKSGRSSPHPTGVFREMRFQSVFAAIGETADVAPFPERMRNGQGWLDIDAGGATKDPFVYAGGDLATGPATVIAAIVAGRSAAQAIDEQLGFYHRWPEEPPVDTVTPAEVNPTYMPHHDRSDDHEVEMVTRFGEETTTLNEAEVLEEIDRCLSCGHCNNCGTCFVFCPDGAIIWDEGPRIDHEFCKGCGICVVECPGHVMVLVNEREVSHV
jgi:NADPH-dependent glutamate synthase beta subunit-like oxidoreductase/Pyruvate/2-oxoacid:ferredoxin oxidoreductase delta subunit